MSVDEIVETIEQMVLLRQLSPIERFILSQSWHGHTYTDMARDSSYCRAHIKEIGSRLWNDISVALGERVTKKNFHLVWTHHQKAWIDRNISGTIPQLNINIDNKDHYLPNLSSETPLQFPSGPVPLNSPFYINRPPVEELTYAEIIQPGCVIRIKAPRQMGKTSLLNRIIAHSKQQGYTTVYIDFQEADAAIFANLDKFLRWFCLNVSRQLNINPMLDDYWDEDMGSKVSCKIYFQDYILEQIDSPLVLALNEVNRIFEYPDIAIDFLPMLRFWHEQARVVNSWQKLRLVVVHATEIYISLKINQSPFNIGLSIQLPEFNLAQVENLAQLYGLNWHNSSLSKKLMSMVGGHPYLVNVALYHLRQRDITLDQLLQESTAHTGIYSYHLRSYLEILQHEPQLALAIKALLNTEESVQLEARIAYKLESLGLIQLNGNQAKLSCQLYRLYFREQLLSQAESQVQPNSLFNCDLIKESEQENEELLRLNTIYKPTLVADRLLLNNYLEQEWKYSASHCRPLSLILCYVNYLCYKERGGILTADEWLQQIEIAISSCVNRPSDLVVLYAPEKFALVLPNTDKKSVIHLVEKIQKTITNLIIHHHPEIVYQNLVPISVGFATKIGDLESNFANIFNAAEQSLLMARGPVH